MLRSIRGGVLLGWLLAGLLLADAAQAAPTPQQKAKAKAADAALKKGAGQAKARKFKEAAESLKTAQTAIAELNADGPDGIRLAAPLRKPLEELYGDLELEGQTLSPLEAAPAMPDPPAKPEPTKPGTKPAAPASPAAPSAPTGNVSFMKQIVPLFSGKCGGCHIRTAKGGFSLASYNALIKGTKDGPVLAAKQSSGSRLLQLIKEGDMPRGGGTVSPEEIALITAWIDQGAKFDGADPAAAIADANLLDGNANVNRESIPVQMATGKETVRFASDVAPVLMDHCFRCHGAQQQVRGMFNMDYFKGLLNGGESGQAIKPGKAAESLLIKMVRGTAEGGPMPPKGQPPLSEEQITTIERWINEGAKFDGYDVNRPLVEIAAVAHAERITPEELSGERAKRSHDDWKLVSDSGDQHEESSNFLVYGNTGQESLKDVLKVAEAQGAKLQKTFKLPAGPLTRGRISIFVFEKKFDYGEVGRMIEHRELPPEARGHWRYTTVDSYVFIVPPKGNEYSLSGLLGQQIAGAVVAAQGHVPRWFAEGSARAITPSLDPKDTRFRIWDDRIPQILASGTKPDGFLTGSGEDNDVLGYGFVKFLRSDAGRYQSLLNAVRGGTPFAAAFAKAYGGSVEQVVGAWTSRMHY